MTDQGWVKAGELHDGSKVLSSRKEYEVVESIEYKGYNEIEVYNLIVENYHTFFITELGLKVHNIDCKNATLGQIFKQVGGNISDTKIKGDFEDVIKKLDDIAGRNNIEEYIKNFDSRFRGLDPNNLDEIKKIISDTSKDIDNHSSSLFKGTEGVSNAEGFYRKNPSDPIRDVLGSGIESNPKEWDKLINTMKDNGVEIVYRDGTMAYSPGLVPGAPGQLIIDKNASMSALIHEYQHYLDDVASGLPGMRQLYEQNPRIIKELRAYMKEIKISDELGLKDVSEQLWKNYRQERDHILNLFKE